MAKNKSSFDFETEEKSEKKIIIKQDCSLNDSKGKFYHLKKGDELPEIFNDKSHKGFFDSFKNQGII